MRILSRILFKILTDKILILHLILLQDPVDFNQVAINQDDMVQIVKYIYK